MRFALLAIAALCACLPVESTTLAGFVNTRTDVDYVASIAKDIRDMSENCMYNNKIAAETIYIVGKNSPFGDRPGLRSLQRLGQGLSGPNSTYVDPTYAFQINGLTNGDLSRMEEKSISHFADDYITTAFKAGDCFRAVEAVKATTLWMQAAHMLWDGLMLCASDTSTVGQKYRENIDSFIALWIGSLQTTLGDQDGHSLYSMTQKAGSMFGDSYIARANLKIMEAYENLAGDLSFEDSCSSTSNTVPKMWAAINKITSYMLIPQMQLLIDALYEEDQTAVRLYGSIVVPQLSQCRHSTYTYLKKAIIDDDIDSREFSKIFYALVSTFECLDLDCSYLGTYSKDSDVKCDGDGAPKAMAGYSPKTRIRQVAKIDLDIHQMKILMKFDSDTAWDMAIQIYRNGKNSNKFDSMNMMKRKNRKTSTVDNDSTILSGWDLIGASTKEEYDNVSGWGLIGTSTKEEDDDVLEDFENLLSGNTKEEDEDDVLEDFENLISGNTKEEDEDDVLEDFENLLSGNTKEEDEDDVLEDFGTLISGIIKEEDEDDLLEDFETLISGNTKVNDDDFLDAFFNADVDEDDNYEDDDSFDDADFDDDDIDDDDDLDDDDIDDDIDDDDDFDDDDFDDDDIDDDYFDDDDIDDDEDLDDDGISRDDDDYDDDDYDDDDDDYDDYVLDDDTIDDAFLDDDDGGDDYIDDGLIPPGLSPFLDFESLQAMATSSKRYKSELYPTFREYFKGDNYVDTLIMDIFLGSGYWGSKSRDVKAAIISTTLQTSVTWMSATAEMAEAISECESNRKYPSMESHEWDEVAALIIGTLEGKRDGGSDDVEDGQLLWNLGNRRALEFGRATTDGYAISNKKVRNLLVSGKGEIETTSCNSLKDTVQRLEHLLLIPVMQSVIEYARLNDGHAAMDTTIEIAMGEAYANAILPMVDRYSKPAADVIARNMLVNGVGLMVPDGPQAVADAFNLVARDFGVECEFIGKRFDIDTCKNYIPPVQTVQTLRNKSDAMHTNVSKAFFVLILSSLIILH